MLNANKHVRFDFEASCKTHKKDKEINLPSKKNKWLLNDSNPKPFERISTPNYGYVLQQHVLFINPDVYFN